MGPQCFGNLAFLADASTITDLCPDPVQEESGAGLAVDWMPSSSTEVSVVILANPTSEKWSLGKAPSLVLALCQLPVTF